VWQVDPLLGSDREISKNTTAVTEQQLCKQACLHSKTVSPSGKNVTTEVEDIVGICYQTTIGEDRAD
jgi:hypothetical protein